MDALLAFKQTCPFLRKTSASGLRKLSTAPSPAAATRGKSRLLARAEMCPIMSTALAVQSSVKRRGISSSPVCPFASTVDAITAVPRAFPSCPASGKGILCVFYLLFSHLLYPSVLSLNPLSSLPSIG